MHWAGPLPFVSSIGNAASDAAFLQALKAAAAAAAGSSGAAERGRARAGAAAAPTHAQLRRLSLREEDVAKVTREGISHVAFHPDLAHLVVATGDKQGHVALWDVDKKTAHEVCTRRSAQQSAGRLCVGVEQGYGVLVPPVMRQRPGVCMRGALPSKALSCAYKGGGWKGEVGGLLVVDRSCG